MLSPLQRYILEKCCVGGKVDRRIFLRFYPEKSAVKAKLRVPIITQSLERLIDRGMLVGYGMRTPCKWFITDVKITSLGKRKWSEWLLSKQAKLPWKEAR